MGAQLLLISFATTRLHGICNGSLNRMEDGGGGGTHPSATALGLRISAPPYPPQISEILFGIGRGHKNVLSSVTRLQEFKLLQARVTLTACLCPHGLLFFQQSCHVGNLLSYNLSLLCITVYSRKIIFCVIF